jgi:hypothetical protein
MRARLSPAFKFLRIYTHTIHTFLISHLDRVFNLQRLT